MPGSIHISATQPPATPLFLQVAVGKREYSGNIEQDGLSFPVTSLRDSMAIMLYNADRELISKTELHTKTVVESGTTDVVFTLDSGEIILQLQFLLSDDDRKRIQEMRSSAMKRKQQELLGDGCKLNLPDNQLSKRLVEKIADIESRHDQTKLQRNMSLDDLPYRVILSETNVDPHMKASRVLLLQSEKKGHGNGSNKDPNGSKNGHGNGKPESRSSSAVKKMISAFESTASQQGILRSENAASLTLSSGRKETDETIVPLGDEGSNYYRSRKQVSFLELEQNSGQNESRRRRPSGGRDGASKQKVRDEQHDVSRSRRKSHEAKYRRSTGPFSLEQLHSLDSSRIYLEYPLNYLVATSSTWLHPHVCVTTASRGLKDLLEVENLSSLNTHIKHADESEILESTGEDSERSAGAGGSGGFWVLVKLNGWLINQGMRAAIVVIACGAVFLNNR